MLFLLSGFYLAQMRDLINQISFNFKRLAMRVLLIQFSISNRRILYDKIASAGGVDGLNGQYFSGDLKISNLFRFYFESGTW
jgi:hypothetical protein